MEYDQDKVDDMVLALLHLTSSRGQFGTRAWKGLNSEALDRLHQKGLIGDPREKSPTVTLTEPGAQRARELFLQHFGKQASGGEKK